MIKVNNENELYQILKLISKNAVNSAKNEVLQENLKLDPASKWYHKQYDEDVKTFGSLSEQEETAEEDEEKESPPKPEPEAKADDADAEEAEAGEAEQQEKEPENVQSEDFGVSFESVIDAINNLRAGKSLKNDAIKDSASAYYDRLTEPERKVLLLFLKSLSQILAGSLKGSSAADPSDEPYNIIVKTEEEPQAQAQSKAQPQPASDAQEKDDEEADEEDTSPPIKVNESQDKTKLLKRIRRIMLS